MGFAIGKGSVLAANAHSERKINIQDAWSQIGHYMEYIRPL
jgi:hypothetical protein